MELSTEIEGRTLKCPEEDFERTADIHHGEEHSLQQLPFFTLVIEALVDELNASLERVDASGIDHIRYQGTDWWRNCLKESQQ